MKKSDKVLSLSDDALTSMSKLSVNVEMLRQEKRSKNYSVSELLSRLKKRSWRSKEHKRERKRRRDSLN